MVKGQVQELSLQQYADTLFCATNTVYNALSAEGQDIDGVAFARSEAEGGGFDVRGADAVDGLAVGAHPFADGCQALDSLRREAAFGVGGDVEEKVAVA